MKFTFDFQWKVSSFCTCVFTGPWTMSPHGHRFLTLQVRKIYFTLDNQVQFHSAGYVRIWGWRANKYKIAPNGCVYIFLTFWGLYWSYTPTGFSKQIKAFYCSETTSIPQATQYFLSQLQASHTQIIMCKSQGLDIEGLCSSNYPKTAVGTLPYRAITGEPQTSQSI